MDITDPMVLYLIQTFKKMFVPAEKGKGLSTNDFTNEYKNKLDGLSSGGNEEKYAVGDCFITTREGDPAELLGYGEWLKVEGRSIVGASDEYPVGSTGGEATHTLTEDELPEVSGSVNFRAWSTGAPFVNASGSFSSGGTTSNTAANFGSGGSNQAYRILKHSFGGGEAHNNMPPYYAMYIWLRIA